MSIKHLVQFMNGITDSGPGAPDFTVVDFPINDPKNLEWCLYGLPDNGFVHKISSNGAGKALRLVLWIPIDRESFCIPPFPKTCTEEINLRLDYVRQAIERQAELNAWRLFKEIAVLPFPNFLGGKSMMISRTEFDNKYHQNTNVLSDLQWQSAVFQ